MNLKGETNLLRNGLAIQVWRFIALAILILSASCTPSTSAIKIESSPLSVQVNDTIKVLIKVENIANLTGLELHLSFDANVLEVTQLNEGGFIIGDFKVQNIFDNSKGTIDYAIAQIDRAPATGSGTLLEIVFRAKASGDIAIRFRGTQAAPEGVLLSDSDGKAIQVTLSNGSIKVK